MRDELPERSPPRVSLVIYHQEGAEIVPLAPRARLVIGRVPEVDISIPEATLSRQHARIELIGDEVWIEDLGSSNGTRVNGAPIDRCRLEPGDDVLLGTVAVSVHASARYAQNLELHGAFVAALDEELARARTFHHELSLLLVREGEPQLFAEWSRRVRQVLGPVDRIALHSVGTVEILLPETPANAARQRARSIIAVAAGLRCGVATQVTDQATSNELLAAAEAALEKTTTERPIVGATHHTPRGTPSVRSPARPTEPKPLLDGAAMREMQATVERIAGSSLPVLLYGETGCGKEVAAREIHEGSPRRRVEMRFINCGAIPRDLVQSMLFGHERGTFTGADQQRKGVFEQADGSTLLLDEVGELPPEAQVSLLRVLESGRVSRLGSSQEIPVDVRVISATHRDLETMAEAGEFRRDLLYRLNALTLRIPPLRQRRDEIRPLAEHFLAAACAVSGVPARRLAPRAVELLERYQWPGNVRELRNTLERAVLVGNTDVVSAEDLPERLRAPTAKARPTAMVAHDPTEAALDSEPSVLDFKNRVRAFERTTIRRALERTGWNKTRAAEALQMPLRTLMHKVAGLELAPEGAVFGGALDDTAPALLALEDETSEAGDPRPFKLCVQQYETRLLLAALKAARWNRARAAKRLGMPLSTLTYKIRSYKLDESNGA